MSANQARASSRHSDLEEGETFSSSSRASSRSDSSYNPSLKVAADPDVVSRAIEKQQAEAPSPVPKDPQSSVSAEQLRQRAQGALLSLKPHNIAYDELVAEGLNPSILKILYEQVGLKISSSSGNASKTSDHATKLASEQTAPAASTSTDHTSPKASNASPPSASSPSSDPKQLQTEKPLERKELIARKLAAAAQAAAARTAKVPSVESNAVAKDAQSAPTPSSSATSDESLVKKTAVPVRQKNKAQTELARQRILDLQRQAALKSQQKNKETQPFQVSGQDAATDNSNAAAPAAQHPLPVRPPIPQSSFAATLPGLVMLESNQHDPSLQTPRYASPAVTMDSTPIPRPSQRKRPRASDFDELESGSKKHMVYGNDTAGPAGPEKLIIEFSDDESLYDDDQMMDTSEEFEAPQTASRAPSRPALPKYPSATSTPQGSTWQSDTEDMQRKNQEIQEMHRRIAYLEEKRKAKAKLQAAQADGADSTHVTDDSGKSSSLSTTESNPPTADKTNPSSGSSSNPVQQASTLTDKLQPASKPEAPSGSGTSRVAQIESNDSPASSVPLETSTAAPFSKSDGETNLPPVSNDTERRSPSQSRSESSSSAMDESADVSSPSQASSSNAPAVDGESTGMADQQTSALPTGSVHSEHDTLASPSNITGSTKGESSDSSDGGDDDDDDDDDDGSDQDSTDNSNTALDHPRPEHTLPAANEDVTMEDPVNQTSPSEGFRRESSADSNESDAYEPPEPEDTAEPDSPYSPPPFSPPPHASLDETAGNTVAFLDETPTGEKLTDAPPVPVLEDCPDSQAGTHGSQSSNTTATVTATATTGAAGTKYTPYISPLRQFKAYRYHPAFTADVSNGYRSLTYSHDIAWDRPFCHYELAGGVCNDRSCEFQHFRDITLSDDKVLIEMGSVPEGQTETKKEQYRAGLKEIINEMRRDKVKDFSTVASEIVAYRRRFLQDSTCVVPL